MNCVSDRWQFIQSNTPQTLNRSEGLFFKRCSNKVNFQVPAGIIECLDLNAIAVLPFTIAVKAKPILEFLKLVHVK